MATMTTTTTTEAGAPNGVASGSGSGAAAQVPIRLSTTSSSISIPQVPYMVPLDWRRTQLSTLVNRLLGRGGAVQTGEEEAPSVLPSIPLDFIVNGTLLRTSLAVYLSTHQLSSETTLDITYLPSVLPPRYTAAFQHDDWIASVDASTQDLFLTASYDGSLRVMGARDANTPLLTFRSSASSSPNTSLVDACWVGGDGGEGASRAVASAGMDGVVRVWAVDSTSLQHDPTRDPAALRPAALWRGKTSSYPLSSVHASRSGSHILTSSWDGSLSLWSHSSQAPPSAALAGDSDDEDEGLSDADEPARKRRKKAKGAAAARSARSAALDRSALQTMWHVAPTSSLSLSLTGGPAPGRNARIARALLDRNDAAGDEAYSAGWDGCVRSWDVREGGRANAVKSSGERAVLDLDQFVGTPRTLLTSHLDRGIAVWDMRSETTHISLSLPNAHAAPVSTIRAHPTSPHLFLSAAHDGSLKLWDVRSPKQALFGIARGGVTAGAAGAATASGAGGEKILALDWTADGQGVVSGGEDKRLTLHVGEGMGRGV